MNRIEIPADVMAKIITCDQGRSTIMPCKVDWPGLQLTNDQRVQNEAARAKGKPAPHPDPSYVELVFWR